MTTVELDAYDRALAAEPGLRAIAATVDALCALVRRNDVMCAGCVWKRIIKPLARPLIGWERGLPLAEAKDSNPDGSHLRFMTGGELLDECDEQDRRRGPATTDTERWLRTPEAWDAVTRRWLTRLHTADPANGHGLSRAATGARR